VDEPLAHAAVRAHTHADGRAHIPPHSDLPLPFLCSGIVGELTTADGVPRYDLRLARAGEEGGICDICRRGFALSSTGLLSLATIERQADLYYNPERVRREITTAGDTPQWQGYVVAVSDLNRVLGAAGVE
jgi:hypothetical protein